MKGQSPDFYQGTHPASIQKSEVSSVEGSGGKEPTTVPLFLLRSSKLVWEQSA